MLITWADVQSFLPVGSAVPYWSRRQGNSYGNFVIERYGKSGLYLKIPSGQELYLSEKDFVQTSALYEGYSEGSIPYSAITKISFRSAYVISLVRFLREVKRPVPTTIRDLYATGGRVWLKPEFGPVSSDWPGVSFTAKAYADRLGEQFNPNSDLILFVGTKGAETPAAWKSRLLCVVKIHHGSSLPSELVIPSAILASFQGSNTNRFGWSLQAQAAWEISDLPSAYDFVANSYASLKVGSARSSYVQLQDQEIQSLLDLSVLPISLDEPDLSDLSEVDFKDPLAFELARILAGIRGRVSHGGKKQSHTVPLRKCEIGLEDLDRIWKLQNHCCALCSKPINLESDNPLMKVSPDRISSINAIYSAENTQLTHLACNWAKNAGTTEQFDEWLTVIRSSI